MDDLNNIFDVPGDEELKDEATDVVVGLTESGQIVLIFLHVDEDEDDEL